jgi:hypothetical protein
MAGSVEVTTLHPPGSGDPKLPPVPNVAPSSSEDSPRVVRIEGDPLWTIPMNMVPKSLPWGKRLRHPRQSAMNPRLSKWMVLPEAVTRCGPFSGTGEIVVVGDERDLRCWNHWNA